MIEPHWDKIPYRLATPDDLKCGISYSRMDTYQLCRARGGWKYEERIPDHAEGVPAMFSRILVHLPIAAWYRSGGVHQPEWEKLWNMFLEPQGGLPPEQPYSLEVAKAIFERYTGVFADEFTQYHIVHVEQMLARDIPHTTTPFLSKPDLVLKRISDGSIWVKDLKARKYTWPGEPFDDQMVSQAWTVDATGFIKQEVTFNISKAGKMAIAISPGVPEIVEPTITAAWLRDYKAIMLELDEIGYRPKNPKSCHAFKVQCAYYERCKSGLTPRPLHLSKEERR